MPIGGLGPVEIVLLLALVIFLFGPKLVPWLSRRVGRSAERLRHADEDFKDGYNE